MDRMFEFPTTIPGQMAMDTDAPRDTTLRCDLCSEPIEAGEKYSDDGSEIAHTSCVRGWFSHSYGRESL